MSLFNRIPDSAAERMIFTYTSTARSEMRKGRFDRAAVEMDMLERIALGANNPLMRRVAHTKFTELMTELAEKQVSRDIYDYFRRPKKQHRHIITQIRSGGFDDAS